MALNIIKNSNNPINLYDIDESTLEKMKNATSTLRSGKNVSFFKSVRDISLKSDVIITMLPSPSQVKEVYLKPKDGILTCLSEENILSSSKYFIDSSTVGPMIVQQISHWIQKLPSIEFLDAPVSGGSYLIIILVNHFLLLNMINIRNYWC